MYTEYFFHDDRKFKYLRKTQRMYLQSELVNTFWSEGNKHTDNAFTAGIHISDPGNYLSWN